MTDSFLGIQSGPRRTTVEGMRVFQAEKPPLQNKKKIVRNKAMVSGELRD